jgi:hypothetical protein
MIALTIVTPKCLVEKCNNIALLAFDGSDFSKANPSLILRLAGHD